MKIQKIHENFRRFINEATRPDFSDLCAIQRSEGNAHEITIYKDNGLVNHDFKTFDYSTKITPIAQVVIGSSQKTGSGPCIPNTHEILQIWVNKNNRGQGWQKTMMDIAFGLAAKEGVGLTSDHKYGTTPEATGGWDKIEKNKNYIKKKTKQGNDTFDYNNSTSDPDDDCASGKKDKVATDHSFISKYPNSMDSSLDVMMDNHKAIERRLKFKPAAPTSEELKTKISKKATAMFRKDYFSRSSK